MTMEQQEVVDNIESRLGNEREHFENGAAELAGNFEELQRLSSSGEAASDELGGKMEAVAEFLKKKENLLVLAILLGNLGTSLWNDLVLKYSGSNYELLRDEPALRAVVKALGVEDAAASFQKKASGFMPMIKQLLTEAYE